MKGWRIEFLEARKCFGGRLNVRSKVKEEQKMWHQSCVGCKCCVRKNQVERQKLLP